MACGVGRCRGGRDLSDDYGDALAAEITAECTCNNVSNKSKGVQKDPTKWVEEGFKLSKKRPLIPGQVTGTQEMPLRLPEKIANRMSAGVRRI